MFEERPARPRSAPLAGALLGLSVVLSALLFFAWLRNANLQGSADASFAWETELLRHNIDVRLQNATKR